MFEKNVPPSGYFFIRCTAGVNPSPIPLGSPLIPGAACLVPALRVLDRQILDTQTLGVGLAQRLSVPVFKEGFFGCCPKGTPI